MSKSAAARVTPWPFTAVNVASLAVPSYVNDGAPVPVSATPAMSFFAIVISNVFSKTGLVASGTETLAVYF